MLKRVLSSICKDLTRATKIGKSLMSLARIRCLMYLKQFQITTQKLEGTAKD